MPIIRDAARLQRPVSRQMSRFPDGAGESRGVQVAQGVDEISVALVADAYARTRRSTALSVAQSIAASDGSRSAAFVALTMEYPRP